MSKEKVFNIFPVCKDDIINKIGYKTHIIEGNDAEKIKFLQMNIEKDKNNLSFVDLPENFYIEKGDAEKIRGISILNYNNLVLNNSISVLLENIFQHEDSSNTPLFVATILKDDNIIVDEIFKSEPIHSSLKFKKITERIPKHYFEAYLTNDGFDLFSLLNDDFFKAIKLLFQNKFYVSSIKLLLSTIDSISFLEFGDESKIFVKWLEKYCELNKVGITNEELWEFRNSLLHMTNNKSRKVIQNKVSPLQFYIASDNSFKPTSGDNTKFFNLNLLIDEYLEGLKRWSKCFEDDSIKLDLFFTRYDLIISDYRYTESSFGI